MVTVILRYFDFMFIICDAIIMTSTCTSIYSTRTCTYSSTSSDQLCAARSSLGISEYSFSQVTLEQMFIELVRMSESDEL